MVVFSCDGSTRGLVSQVPRHKMETVTDPGGIEDVCEMCVTMVLRFGGMSEDLVPCQSNVEGQ